MTKITTLSLPEGYASLIRNLQTSSGKVNFIRGKLNKGSVLPLKHQGSHMLSSFTEANCLIVTPKNKTSFESGEKVKIHILPDHLL